MSARPGAPSALLEANLRALATRDPALARSVRAATPDRRLSFVRSRTGLPVPSVSVSGRKVALHSLVDPEREALRIMQSHQTAGFAFFLGLGAGYEVARALSRDELFGAVVIEQDAAVLRALLEGADLARLLADDRLHLAVAPSPSCAGSLLLDAWAPALMGDLCILRLRPWCEARGDWFDPIARGLARALERTKADYAAQGRFGARWFANAMANLPVIERADLSLGRIERAIVTGAGPSLDLQLEGLPRRPQQSLLIATDTSLPALRARGIEPDVALSIDCQPWSYHHFLDGRPSRLKLLLDVSSPPVLGRLAGRPGFFASGHPFSRYIGRHFRELPELDTSGGNVSHAAVSLAYRLGAREIALMGVDLSFPLGSPYARGTYLHPLLRSQEVRLRPAETGFYSMLVSTPATRRERTPGGLRYITPLMRDYREALDELIASIDARVLRREPFAFGAESLFPSAHRHPSWEAGFVMGEPKTGWLAFLADYAEKLAALPSPAHPLPRWFRSLGPDELETWRTLLPLAPALARRGRQASGADRPLQEPAPLEQARAWAIDRASRLLAKEHGAVADKGI